MALISDEEHESEEELRVEEVSKESYTFDVQIAVKRDGRDFEFVNVHNRAEIREILGVHCKGDVCKIRLKNNVSLFYNRSAKVEGDSLVSGGVHSESGSLINFWVGTAVFLADDGVAPVDLTEDLLELVKKQVSARE